MDSYLILSCISDMHGPLYEMCLKAAEMTSLRQAKEGKVKQDSMQNHKVEV